jgi:hypothetical protein
MVVVYLGVFGDGGNARLDWLPWLVCSPSASVNDFDLYIPIFTKSYFVQARLAIDIILPFISTLFI